MTTSPSHEDSGGVVPPEAFDRVKRERDQFKTEAEQAKSGLQQALLVDQVYGHLTAREYADSELRPADPYGTAKFIAGQLPRDTANPAEAVDRWIAQASTLLRPPQVAPAPAPTTPASPAPQVPQGRGPHPGADGADLGTGPFPVNGKEFKEFVARYGMDAVPAAVANGTFYFSDENQAAQATARKL